MIHTLPCIAVFRAPSAPVPNLSLEERTRLFDETDTNIRRDCAEMQKLRETERKARKAGADERKEFLRRCLDLIYNLGASLNRYRDHELQTIKGGEDKAGGANGFLYKDYGLGHAEICRCCFIERYFQRQWADQAPDMACIDVIEVIEVIADTRFAPMIQQELWEAWKRTGCSAEKMEHICDEVNGWLVGLRNDDSVHKNDVAGFIDQAMQRVGDKTPLLLADKFDQLAHVRDHDDWDLLTPIEDGPERWRKCWL